MEFSMNTGLGGILAFIAGIWVWIKLFQKEGVMKGILGFLCMLYTFIWGLQNMKNEELKLKTWMYVWTGAIVLGIALNVIGAMGGGDGGY